MREATPTGVHSKITSFPPLLSGFQAFEPKHKTYINTRQPAAARHRPLRTEREDLVHHASDMELERDTERPLNE